MLLFVFLGPQLRLRLAALRFRARKSARPFSAARFGLAFGPPFTSLGHLA